MVIFIAYKPDFLNYFLYFTNSKYYHEELSHMFFLLIFRHLLASPFCFKTFKRKYTLSPRLIKLQDKKRDRKPVSSFLLQCLISFDFYFQAFEACGIGGAAVEYLVGTGLHLYPFGLGIEEFE